MNSLTETVSKLKPIGICTITGAGGVPSETPNGDGKAEQPNVGKASTIEDGGTGIPSSCYPFQNKYSHKIGTHCWFCDKRFSEKIIRTREHIIPRSIIGNRLGNYVASCYDCNHLKANRNAKEFAEFLDKMLKSITKSVPAKKKIKLMRNRAWKLYNKTSKLHNALNAQSATQEAMPQAPQTGTKTINTNKHYNYGEDNTREGR
jgi:Zn-finger protein